MKAYLPEVVAAITILLFIACVLVWSKELSDRVRQHLVDVRFEQSLR